MTRAELARKIVATKWTRHLTWRALASAIGRNEAATTSALLGQDTLNAHEAAAAGKLLGLTQDEVGLLQRSN